jgi:hypothetical protein
MDLTTIIHLISIGLTLLVLVIVGGIVIKVFSPRNTSSKRSWLDYIADMIRDPLEYLHILHEPEETTAFGNIREGDGGTTRPKDKTEVIAEYIFSAPSVQTYTPKETPPKKEEPKKPKENPKQRFDDIIE